MDNTPETKNNPRQEQPEQEKPRQFHFWTIMFVCWGVVAFCGLAAWVATTFFYD